MAMLMHRWFPWRYLLKRLARSRGFIDPLTLYARMQQFAQPSEVAEPVELLRAGAVFHARGLINSRVLQHNLDWVWPYWVERQFDPADVSFLPRAFSLTHINLTHRNWTTVGLPGREAMPIVDPRGLLTPFWDGWSIDVWCLDDDGRSLLPSRARHLEQSLMMDEGLSVRSYAHDNGQQLSMQAALIDQEAEDVCQLSVRALQNKPGWLIVSARPCNPEGVSFIDRITLAEDRRSWLINQHDTVRFDQPVERHLASTYHDADVFVHLHEREDRHTSSCSTGLATAAAMFRLETGVERCLKLEVPVDSRPQESVPLAGLKRLGSQLKQAWRGSAQQGHLPFRGGGKGNHVSAMPEPASATGFPASALRSGWAEAIESRARLELPDAEAARLYEAAVRTLVLCTPDDAYAGPFTYRRFWYRDAVFIGHGLLCAGLVKRARHLVDRFPLHQSLAGYYHSQAGEWDANGEVLWLAQRLWRFTGELPSASLWASLCAGADWIEAKRLPVASAQAVSGARVGVPGVPEAGQEFDPELDPHAGLLPAGFSAEHLGPNDHYYWDNYWGCAGLESASRLAHAIGDTPAAAHYQSTAAIYSTAIERSLDHACRRLGRQAIPAAPTRRMDAGAIGSVVSAYPLQIGAPDDARLSGTLDYLLEHCFHEDGFFQDMIHSGINAYLTLHVAQALLRRQDLRYRPLIRAIAKLASPTGQWPEAVHPHTGGGCMGDGQHAWAAAEWVAMMRYCFLREEGETLVLGSGLMPEWLAEGTPLRFGPAPSAFGRVDVSISPAPEPARSVTCGTRSLQVSWHGDWHVKAPAIQIRVPDFEPVDVSRGDVQRSVIVAERVTYAA